jgi:hypothetical protein
MKMSQPKIRDDSCLLSFLSFDPHGKLLGLKNRFVAVGVVET